jgi:hypothetical protein
MFLSILWSLFNLPYLTELGCTNLTSNGTSRQFIKWQFSLFSILVAARYSTLIATQHKSMLTNSRTPLFLTHLSCVRYRVILPVYPNTYQYVPINFIAFFIFGFDRTLIYLFLVVGLLFLVLFFNSGLGMSRIA